MLIFFLIRVRLNAIGIIHKLHLVGGCMLEGSGELDVKGYNVIQN